jgi:hypothetical protein
MFRAALATLTVAAFGGAALAQPKDDTAPPPRPVPKANPLPQPTPASPWAPGQARPITTLPSGFTYQTPAPVVYPSYGYGWAYGTLPPRIVYGPSVSPLQYPYQNFVPGYPYPGYTMVSPYPRTVSTYSSGPSLYPPLGVVGRGGR